jgi:hypothetical protein
MMNTMKSVYSLEEAYNMRLWVGKLPVTMFMHDVRSDFVSPRSLDSNKFCLHQTGSVYMHLPTIEVANCVRGIHENPTMNS